MFNYDPLGSSAAVQSPAMLPFLSSAPVAKPGFTLNTTYGAKVLTIDPTNLIQFLKLNETTGTNADDSSTENNDGTYNAGVTLNNTLFKTGDPAPRWDGTGDVLNEYSAGFIADFSVTEFTIAGWIKVFDSGVGGDGVERRFVTFQVDGSNSIYMRKTTTGNTINFAYVAGGTTKQVQAAGTLTTEWMHWALTVSVANDRLKAYLNGAQVGSTQTALGTWVGALNSATTVIGANATAANANVWNGWLAYVTIYKAELSAANVLALATYP